jgi:hypothetical protein
MIEGRCQRQFHVFKRSIKHAILIFAKQFAGRTSDLEAENAARDAATPNHLTRCACGGFDWGTNQGIGVEL